MFKNYIKLACTIFFSGIIAVNASAVSAESYMQGPVQGKISSSYGHRSDPFNGNVRFHSGLDIASEMGAPIYAMQDGIVIFSGKNGGYGNVIVIDHQFQDIPQLPRLQTLYGHNSRNLVSKGDHVKRGQVIGLVGSTGRSTGPHLHFSVVYKNKTVNPIEYLTKLPSYLEYAQKIRESKNYTAVKNYNKNGMGGY